MDVLTDTEIDTLVKQSRLVKKYEETIDNQSAYEIIMAKLEEAGKRSAADADNKSSKKEEPSVVEKVLNNPVARQVERTAASIITRSLLGALGLGGRSSSKKKSSWF
jgi:hypothetical protein